MPPRSAGIAEPVVPVSPNSFRPKGAKEALACGPNHRVNTPPFRKPSIFCTATHGKRLSEIIKKISQILLVKVFFAVESGDEFLRGKIVEFVVAL